MSSSRPRRGTGVRADGSSYSGVRESITYGNVQGEFSGNVKSMGNNLCNGVAC